MKKFKIKDKKLFNQAIVILVLSVTSFILIVAIASYLKANGLSGFFTTNIYKEAFKINERDIKLINTIEVSMIVFIIYEAYIELTYNKKIRDLEVIYNDEIRNH